MKFAWPPQCVSLQPTTALGLPLQAAVQWAGQTPADASERVQGQQASVHGERGAAVEASQWRPAGKSPPYLTHLPLHLTPELCLLPHSCTLIAQIAPTTQKPLLSSDLQILPITFLSETKMEAALNTERLQPQQCCWIFMTNLYIFWEREDFAVAPMHVKLSVGLALLSIEQVFSKKAFFFFWRKPKQQAHLRVCT